MDLDTIKSAVIGSGGVTIQLMDFIPDVIKLVSGVVTIAYFVYKIQLIRKQLKE